ncbi:hypothetical protein LCGC14_2257380 [marine sediment metagenome]|uniref:Uncharacterized protein n=1 Tax=marine sediment metagenome TaxID=412755 RepID=A0A0F9DN65_9ZZZZ
MNEKIKLMSSPFIDAKEVSENEIYHTALKKWGIKFQVIMLGEEQAELFKAISKQVRKPTTTRAIEIAEELADVEVMIGQMKIAFGIPDEQVRVWKKAKLTKLGSLCGLIK